MANVETRRVTETDQPGLPSKITNAREIAKNQTSGGTPRNENMVNNMMPMSEPHRSYRYAGSRGNRLKHSPANWPGPAMMVATARKIRGNTTQGGGPDVVKLVKKMTDLSSRFTATGYADRNPINPRRATGE
jgi:hypothetical protein